MKIKILSLLIMIIFFGNMSSQETKKYIYKGKIDKYPVTLYLVEEISGCPSTHYSGMYKYDNASQWLYLEISDDEDNKLVMVEGGITGIISVKRNGEHLTGYWISPDGNKKLNVNLKKAPVNSKILKPYEDRYDQVNYEMNDC